MLSEKRRQVRESYGISGKPAPAGWTEAASLVDLSPRPGPQVSEEVRNMIAAVQANMIAREARLIAALRSV